MNVETVPIEQVHPLDRNPRRHPEKQIEELVKSIKHFGQYRPLVVDEGGTILAGNGLHSALLRIGADTVAVHRVSGLTEQQKTKLILADNRTGALSNDDYDIVDAMLKELEDFEVPGYDPDVIRNLLADAEEVLAQGDAYGLMGAEEAETLRARESGQEALHAGALAGTLPEPAQAVVQVAAPASDAAPVRNTSSGETYCPTCGRSWQ